MKNKIIFAVIILLAFVLRTYRLDSIPVSVSWDEAAIGYNAYSIIKTGNDEYGSHLPLLFKSFSDYKLPGYIYSVAASVSIFGLNAFAVRLPSAIYGTITVALVFFLAKEMLAISSTTSKSARVVPWIAMIDMAISPWHLQFSRGGFESNGQLLFLTAGFLFLLMAVRKPFCYIVSAIFFGISFYFYYTTRVITPLLGLVYVMIYGKQLFKFKREILIALAVFAVIIAPIAPHFFGKSGERGEQVAIYNDSSINFPFVQMLAKDPHSIIAKVVFNRRLAFLNTFLENYFRNNSFEFLFTSGDLYPRHDIIGMGVMYLWELPLVLLGVYSVIVLKDKKKWLLLGWWVIGAIPASLTTGAPHALRTLSTLPVFILFSAFGIGRIVILLLDRGRKALLYGSITLIVVALCFFVQYWNYYYSLSAVHYAIDWGDGHGELVNYIKSTEPHYDKIYITGRFFKPYIYFLFYNHYDPATYLREKGTDKGFGKYVFYPADWESRGQSLEDIDFSKRAVEPRSLYVFPSSYAKKTLQTVKEITSINGKSVFILQHAGSIQ